MSTRANGVLIYGFVGGKSDALFQAISQKAGYEPLDEEVFTEEQERYQVQLCQRGFAEVNTLSALAVQANASGFASVDVRPEELLLATEYATRLYSFLNAIGIEGVRALYQPGWHVLSYLS